MREIGNRLCRDCKHCLPIWEVDGYTAFCENALTKAPHEPIGFLGRGSNQCEHFEEAQGTAESLTLSGGRADPGIRGAPALTKEKQ